MSRFTDQQAVTVDGQNLTVKTRPGLDLAAVAAIPGLIQQAKALLGRTNALLYGSPLSHEVIAMSKRYFLTGNSGPSKSELAQMHFVVTATRTGLSNDMTLKIGSVVARDESNAHGSVASFVGNQGTKPYHTVLPELGPTKHFWQKQPNTVNGAMKLRDSSLLGPLGLITMIHEATHKFAGTIDYSYFSEDGLTPESKFTNREKALANADSYAYFVINVGEEMKWNGNTLFSNPTRGFDNPLYTG
jgi:hypothetical protein